MCLAIPGRIVAIEEDPADGRVARVDFGVGVRAANLLYLPEAQVGDFVIVQAGFATTRVDEAEAREALACARSIDVALGAAAPPPAADGARAAGV